MPRSSAKGYVLISLTTYQVNALTTDFEMGALRKSCGKDIEFGISSVFGLRDAVC